MLGIARRTGWSVFVVRMLIELTVLGIGWILGGNVGIGTLAFAIGIGPAVQASLWLFKQMPNAISGEQSEEVPAAL
jgi:uncharacterized membrane protein YczE